MALFKKKEEAKQIESSIADSMNQTEAEKETTISLTQEDMIILNHSRLDQAQINEQIALLREIRDLIKKGV